MKPGVWIAAQLMAASTATADPTPKIKRHFNPRTPGRILPQGTTAAVLVALCRQPTEWARRWQIVAAVGRNDRTVDSSLLYLRSLQLIEVAPDARRSDRYLRYRVLPAGLAYLRGMPGHRFDHKKEGR